MKLAAEDLHEVFLLVIRPDKKNRRHLPIVRRHPRSVANACRMIPEMQIDIYYSGVLLARKPKNKSRVVMEREWKQENPFSYEVSA